MNSNPVDIASGVGVVLLSLTYVKLNLDTCGDIPSRVVVVNTLLQ